MIKKRGGVSVKKYRLKYHLKIYKKRPDFSGHISLLFII